MTTMADLGGSIFHPLSARRPNTGARGGAFPA
jgi:hypothetical protein